MEMLKRFDGRSLWIPLIPDGWERSDDITRFRVTGLEGSGANLARFHPLFSTQTNVLLSIIFRIKTQLIYVKPIVYWTRDIRANHITYNSRREQTDTLKQTLQVIGWGWWPV